MSGSRLEREAESIVLGTIMDEFVASFGEC